MKTGLSFLLIIALSIVAYLPANAQTITVISGTVIDEDDKPAVYATVRLINNKDSTILKGFLTPDNGRFSFERIPVGAYFLSVEMMGYDKIRKGPFIISSSTDKLDVGNIKLKVATNQLDGITVTSVKKPFVERQMDKTILNVENSLIAEGNNAFEILEKAPGISVDQDGNISMKGRQGTVVLMDGKPTYLSREELRSLLRATSGTAIQTIELISNPSAKYDAEGNAGIINIKFKKNTSLGTNGTLTAGAGYGIYYKSNAGLTLNHREKKFNLFGSYNFSANKSKTELEINRENEFERQKTYMRVAGPAVGKDLNNNYKAGIDYFINDKNTIGFAVNGFLNDNTELLSNKMKIGKSPFVADSSVVGNISTKSKYRNVGYNLNYKSVLDTLGQELTFDFDYSKYNNSSNTNSINMFADASGLPYKDPYVFRNESPSIISVWSGKVDYTLPLSSEMKLETGLKTSFVRTDNDFRFENLKVGQWLNDPLRSNHFIYEENINAAYLNLNRKFSSTSVQIGLRVEQTNSKGNLVNDQRIVKRNYLDFFPSLAVNQTLSENNELNFSYSRRVGRPDYGTLNPFLGFIDLYTYQQGNPFLNPEYSNTFELSYGYKKTFNLTLGYSRTNDVMSTVILSDPEKKLLYLTTQNLAKHTSYNLTTSMPIQLTKWWNSDQTAVVFYNDFRSANLMGNPYKSGKLSYMLSTNQTFEVNPSLNAELSANYMSSQVYGTYGVKPVYGVNFGLGKSFANKNATIKLSANDLFNTTRTKVSSMIPSQVYLLNQKEETRTFRLSLSYRFGGSGIKGPSERTKSSSEEESRIKTGN